MTTEFGLDLKADPQHFETKVVRMLLRAYRKRYGGSWASVEGLDSFDRLSALPYMGAVWGYKVLKPLNLGSILNALEKSILATPLRAGLKTYKDAEDWLYVFSIPTSTALYAVIPGDRVSPEDCQEMRFITYKQFEGQQIAVVRLDDYLQLIWKPED